MTQLAEIREMLRSDAGRRRRTRVVDGLLIAAVVAVAAGFVYYQLDRRLGLNRPARLFLDAVWLLPILFIAWRLVVPAWRRREDEVDVALRYQRRLGIDSDLVAALEFDAEPLGFDEAGRPRADGYGSPRLRGAVVDQAEKMGAAIAHAEEPTDQAVVMRMRVIGGVLAAALLVVALWPRHFTAFVERVGLADVAYPSNTRIDSWSVNERSREALRKGLADDAPTTATVAVGRPVKFELRLSGEIPDYAILDLASESGVSTSLELTPSESDRTIFQAALPAIVESARGRFAAGDTFSETFELTASPLPLATVTLKVTPPAYAAGVALPAPPPGRLSAAVLEGSDVEVFVECANKPLRQAKILIGETAMPLRPTDDTHRTWRAEPANSGLADVRRQIEFAIEVEDTDGFHPAEPLKGSIGLRPDLPPTVAAEVVTKWVLPAGKPSVAYEAADDLGIRGMAVTRQVLRADGSTTADRVEIPLADTGPTTNLAGKFPVSLEGLQLAKGDKVTIRVEARDRRADAGRAVAQSEPLTLEVTDEQGLYEAMAETDQRSARKMDEIIQKQLMMTGRTSSGGGPVKPASPTGSPAPGTTPRPTPLPTQPPAAVPTATSPPSPTPTASGSPSVTNLPAATTPSGGTPTSTNPPAAGNSGAKP